MTPSDEALIDKNLIELTNVIHIGKLTPFLLSNEVYTNETLQTVIGIGSPSEQTRRMILGLKQLKPAAISNFIQSLLDAEQFEAAHILRPDIPVPAPPPPREKAGEDIFYGRLPDINVAVKKAIERYPGSRASACYRMRSKPRGLAAIFVNEIFQGKAVLFRPGAAKDKQLLTDLFTQLGYKVLVFENTSKCEMKRILHSFVQCEDHTTADSCVVVVSSHGKEGCIMCHDSELLSVQDIKSLFGSYNCPALSGKPKLFIIQACGGGNLDTGVPSSTADLGSLSRATRKPAVNDTLIAYSTTPGHLENTTEKGTWYIYFVTDVFMKHAWNTRLLDLLVEVNRRMNRLRADGGEKPAADTVVQGWHKLFFFNPGL